MNKVHAGTNKPICKAKGAEHLVSNLLKDITCRRCLEIITYHLARQHKPLNHIAPQPRSYADGTRKENQP